MIEFKWENCTIKDYVIHKITWGFFFVFFFQKKKISTCCRMRDVWENLFWWSVTNFCEACTTKESGKLHTGYTFTGP